MAREESKKAQEKAPEAEGMLQQQAPRRLQLDETGIATDSSDYWLLSGTPEEVVVRFGDTKASGEPNSVKITHKIVLNYYTAKRLLDALSQTISKYEEALGLVKA